MLLFSLLLSACTGEDPDKDQGGHDTGPPPCETSTYYLDRDADGYGDAALTVEKCEPGVGEVADATDCDDLDATVHPGAEEDCSTEVDANCDGSIGFVDDDNDGWAACEDCDDANPSAYPGAAEFCDGVDSDCDSEVDEDPVNGTLWYPDADGDGAGDAGASLRACDQPEGYGSDFSDCDDTNAAINPDAEEVCNGVDDDCNGTADGSSASDAFDYYDDTDGDGFGNDRTRSSGCELPAGSSLVSGDCDDDDGAVNPDAVETCNGVDDDCEGTTDGTDSADVLTWYLDRDGDGFGDTGYTVASCYQPAGYVDNADDCDDTTSTSNPDATETCDGRDDDCDGTVDEDDASDASTWYVDADSDGYGNATLSSRSCVGPSGTVLTSTDCDDANALVSPAGAELCNSIDDDCDGATDEDASADAATWYLDFDGDGFGDAAVTHAACSVPAGYVADATDCDDGSAAVSPADAELCDGIDDDCDGVTDEDSAIDAPDWFADADGDGYGDPATSYAACEAPAGYLADGGDCDDGSTLFHPGAAESDCDDPNDYNCDGSVGYSDTDGDGFVACQDCDDASSAAYPGAPESCNGVDDDCDTTVDEAGATGSGNWYADTDGDGYGDPAVVDHSCTLPSGWSAAATDCDDSDRAVSPAATEVCATAYDDDCDGDASELRTPDCTRFYLDYDGDGYGSTSSLCACEAVDPFIADNADDCDDGDAYASPAGTEEWGNGVDDDCDGVVDAVPSDSADGILTGVAESDHAGFSVGGAGDVDADGYDDVIVGAYGSSDMATHSGMAYVVRGPIEGTLSLDDADAWVGGSYEDDAVGYSVALGDGDGDGYADMMVGAIGESSVGTSAGTVWLFNGPVSGELYSADATLPGEAANDLAGSAVAFAGDIDGDGIGDLLVGAYGNDTGARGGGSAYLVLGPASGVISLATADAQLYGASSSDAAGKAVSTAGDTDGDGFGDFLVGVAGADDNGSGSGTAFVITGPVTGITSLDAGSTAQMVGEAGSDGAGTTVAGPGDVNGDGYDDVLVGAVAGGTDGRGYLVYGPVFGRVVLSSADTTFSGAGLADDAGYVAAPGDMDGDGVPDVVIGAPATALGGTDGGAAYLFFSVAGGTLDLDDDADAIFFGGADDMLGRAVAGAGDTDADGFSDAILGAYGDATTATDAGAAYVVRGR